MLGPPDMFSNAEMAQEAFEEAGIKWEPGDAYIDDTLTMEFDLWNNEFWRYTLRLFFDARSELLMSKVVYEQCRTPVLPACCHDNAGKRTVLRVGAGLATFIDDPENRNTKFRNPDGTMSKYSYSGGDGLRRTKQEPGAGVVTMVWAGGDYLQERS